MNDKKQTILIVDDTPENITLLSNLLKPDYHVRAALNGERALQIVGNDPKPDMILLDIMMPGLDGYEVCRRLKNDPVTAAIPVIFVTAMSGDQDEEKGLALGAVDYLTKPIRPSITKARIKTHLSLYDQNRELEQRVAARTLELKETRLSIIRQLGRAAEYKDNETGLHVIRMSHYARLIAESYVGEANAWSELVFQAAPMHDIGKIGIPDRILLKPGKLDAEEWAFMKKHVLFGAKIIGDHDSKLLQMAKEIALHHHEKWDGSGYPSGLAGETISLSGRIAAIADVFDALTSDRPYKKAWSAEKAMEYLEQKRGSHFDSQMIGHFKQILPRALAIKDKFAETHDYKAEYH